MPKHLIRLFALSLAAAIALAGCGGTPAGSGTAPSKGTGAPKKGGILKIAVIGNTPTLDIHTSTATIVEQTTFNIFETLFALDSKFAPKPMLADSSEWKSDNKQLVIHLRQGVLFHNDQELTADDAVASINHWLKLSSLGKQYAPNITQVKAADKYTMTIDLKQPAGTLVAALANPNNEPAIMPKSVLDAAGDKPVGQIIGTGPYKLAEFANDKYVRQVRWDKYKPRSEPADGYAGKKEALIDEIQYIPVPEAQTREAGLQTGEYQYIFQVPQDHFATLKTSKDLEMVIGKPTGWSALVLNKKKGPMANPKLRQALNWALDPQALMTAGFGDPAFIRLDSSISPKESPYFGEFDNGQYNHRSLDKARALLKEAGYDGTPIRLMATKEYEYMYKYALVARQQLEEAGFKVDFQVYDWATLVQRRGNPDMYDLFTTGIIFSPLPTAQNVFLSPSWPGWWENPAVQTELDAFNAEVDTAKQKPHWDKIQQLFWQDLPLIHIGDYFNLNAMRKELKGYQSTPNIFFWNCWLE